MGFLRNFILISFIWAFGNSLFAASQMRLDDCSAVLVDQSQPQIKAQAFDSPDENQILTPSSLTSGVIPSQASYQTIIFAPVLAPLTRVLHGTRKKPYLFTFSGTSPPVSLV